MEESGWFERHRSEQALEWMKDAVLYGLEEEFRRDAAVNGRLAAMQQDVLQNKLSPFRAARELMSLFKRKEP
jgi:LAO/AO transport system kinase